jgi:hypothetical protein
MIKGRANLGGLFLQGKKGAATTNNQDRRSSEGQLVGETQAREKIQRESSK